MEELRKIWGKNIELLRLGLTLTQEQFAAKLGVHQSTVARWESGDSAPRDRDKVRIADLDPGKRGVHQLFPLTRSVA